mmetsp:Transcript_43038/g.106193  ORF Transcript_43038/g.106193 Transcript_43038/m.106193 type:complete len:152 (-) Transcript_43038:252-707(-)
MLAGGPAATLGYIVGLIYELAARILHVSIALSRGAITLLPRQQMLAVLRRWQEDVRLLATPRAMVAGRQKRTVRDIHNSLRQLRGIFSDSKGAVTRSSVRLLSAMQINGHVGGRVTLFLVHGTKGLVSGDFRILIPELGQAPGVLMPDLLP